MLLQDPVSQPYGVRQPLAPGIDLAQQSAQSTTNAAAAGQQPAFAPAGTHPWAAPAGIQYEPIGQLTYQMLQLYAGSEISDRSAAPCMHHCR